MSRNVMSLFYFNHNATEIAVDNDCIEQAFEVNTENFKITIERYTDPCLDKVKTKRKYEQWVIRRYDQVMDHNKFLSNFGLICEYIHKFRNKSCL